MLNSIFQFLKREYNNKKDWIIELLLSQGIAMIEKSLLAKDESMSASLVNNLKAIYRSLQKWIDINDDKVSKFVNKFLISQKFYGKVLKNLFKQLEDKPDNLETDKQVLNVNFNLMLFLLVYLYFYFQIVLLFQDSKRNEFATCHQVL